MLLIGIHESLHGKCRTLAKSRFNRTSSILATPTNSLSISIIYLSYSILFRNYNTRDGQFVFIRQYRHGIQETSYELCAGVCEEEDGSPMVSAQRELLEETGYGNGVWKEFMQISPNPSTHTNITYCFLTTDVEKISEQQLEDTENLTVHLLSLQEVKELLQQGSIRQALMAAPLWKYMAERII